MLRLLFSIAVPFFLASILSCDLALKTNQTVTVFNDTLSPIGFSVQEGASSQAKPSTIESGSSLQFMTDGLRSIEFTLDYKQSLYKGHSGLTEDYSRYALRFSEKDSELFFRLETGDKWDGFLPLTKQ